MVGIGASVVWLALVGVPDISNQKATGPWSFCEGGEPTAVKVGPGPSGLDAAPAPKPLGHPLAPPISLCRTPVDAGCNVASPPGLTGSSGSTPTWACSPTHEAAIRIDRPLGELRWDPEDRERPGFQTPPEEPPR